MVKSKKGFSLIEILIVMAIMGFIGLGATSLVETMLKNTRKSSTKEALFHIRKNLQTILENDQAWINTINANAGLNCLQERSAIQCADGPVNNLNVMDHANASYYDSSVLTAGWRVDGQVCNTFSAAGNDPCPFRYNINADLACPPSSPSPCDKPNVTITATFLSSPASDNSPARRMDVADFTFTIERGQSLTYENFRLAHVGGAPGAGPCIAVPGETARPINLDFDNGGNVAVAGTQFTIQPGSYKCEIYAQAFNAPTGYNIRIEGGAINAPIGAGYGAANATTEVHRTISLDLAVATAFEIYHFCTPGTVIAPTNLGAPPPGGGNTTYTSVECSKAE